MKATDMKERIEETNSNTTDLADRLDTHVTSLLRIIFRQSYGNSIVNGEIFGW